MVVITKKKYDSLIKRIEDIENEMAESTKLLRIATRYCNTEVEKLKEEKAKSRQTFEFLTNVEREK